MQAYGCFSLLGRVGVQRRRVLRVNSAAERPSAFQVLSLAERHKVPIPRLAPGLPPQYEHENLDLRAWEAAHQQLLTFCI